MTVAGAGSAGQAGLSAQRGFMRYWLARVVGTSGLQMLTLAMGWQMYERTRQAWDLGLLGLVQFIPALVLSLVAGQVADRFDRARIMAGCFALQCAAALALLHASLNGDATRELLLAVALMLGTARGFQLPAQQALVPMLVPGALLSRATAFSSGGAQVAIMAGPAVAGWILVAGPSAVYGLCLGLQAGACAMVAGIRTGRQRGTPEPICVESLLAGVRFVSGHRILLGALSLDLLAVMLAGATALLPIYARDVLQVGPQGLGVLRAAPAVGALGVSLVLSRVPLRRHIGAKLMAAVTVYALGMLVFGLSRDLLLSLGALAVAGSADMVSVVVRQTLVQVETPDAMRGRVAAINGLFMGASNQIGEFESGATAAVMGPVGSVVFGSLATLCIAAIWLRAFPQLVARDRFESGRP